MNNSAKLCNPWCMPLYIYIAFALLGVVSMFAMRKRYQRLYGDDLAVYTISIIMKVLWGIVIYYLCKNCHEGWAWIIVLLPLIFIVIVLMFIFDLLLRMHDHHHRRD